MNRRLRTARCERCGRTLVTISRGIDYSQQAAGAGFGILCIDCITVGEMTMLKKLMIRKRGIDKWEEKNTNRK